MLYYKNPIRLPVATYFWVVLLAPGTIPLYSLQSPGFIDTETEVREDNQLDLCHTPRELGQVLDLCHMLLESSVRLLTPLTLN